MNERKSVCNKNLLTDDVIRWVDRKYRLHDAAAERLVFTSRAERRELLFLFLTERHVTVSRVVVVWRQLTEQATDAVPVSGRADQWYGARR